jgi:hypothetical protein
MKKYCFYVNATLCRTEKPYIRLGDMQAIWGVPPSYQWLLERKGEPDEPIGYSSRYKTGTDEANAPRFFAVPPATW